MEASFAFYSGQIQVGARTGVPCSKPRFPQLGGRLLLCLKNNSFYLKWSPRLHHVCGKVRRAHPWRKGCRLGLFLTLGCFPGAPRAPGDLDAATFPAQGLWDGPLVWKAFCPLTFNNHPPPAARYPEVCAEEAVWSSPSGERAGLELGRAWLGSPGAAACPWP